MPSVMHRTLGLWIANTWCQHDNPVMTKEMSLLLIGAAMLASASACADAKGDTREPAPPTAESAATPAPRPELTAEEKQFYRDMAKSAWRFLDANYKPATGLVSATADWANTTIWDVGGQFLAFRSAKELGLLSQEEFDKRMNKALATLQKAPLYNNVAFNKVISTTTGGVGEGGVHGFAATDLGRLLVALKILSVQEPQLKASIERVVKRIDMSKIGIMGHSMGGTTAALATKEERRISAGINLDGSAFPGMNNDVRPVELHKPLLFIATEEHESGEGRAREYSGSKSNTYYVIIPGSDHLSFTDKRLVQSRFLSQSQTNNMS